jgi:tRNA threonylcarbamoyladenosine biosynthesis protein TsaB
VSAKILAVDTTSEFGSLALVEGGTIVAETLIHSPEGFGHVLFDRLRQLLEQHQWRLRDIDCYAALAGPGSFTGVRIGLAAVKGLAEANAKPAVAVSNLQTLAACGTRALRAPLLDARRGEVYAALYDSGLRLLGKERVLKLPAWLESLPEGDIELISNHFAPFRGALAGTRFERLPVVEAPRALAGMAGLIAARLYQQGQALDPAALDANYVRRSDAELFWRDKDKDG